MLAKVVSLLQWIENVLTNFQETTNINFANFSMDFGQPQWHVLKLNFGNWKFKRKELVVVSGKIALNLNNVDLNASASKADKLIAKAILVY